MRRLAALLALAILLAPAGAAATGESGRAARRDAADYHALFDIREIVAPAVRRADGSGRCRARGVARILFRGSRDLETGRPTEIVLRCRAGAQADGEPALYDHAAADSPRRIIVWLYRFEDRLIAVDWTALDSPPRDRRRDTLR